MTKVTVAFEGAAGTALETGTLFVVLVVAFVGMAVTKDAGGVAAVCTICCYLKTSQRLKSMPCCKQA